MRILAVAVLAALLVSGCSGPARESEADATAPNSAAVPTEGSPSAVVADLVVLLVEAESSRPVAGATVGIVGRHPTDFAVTTTNETGAAVLKGIVSNVYLMVVCATMCDIRALVGVPHAGMTYGFEVLQTRIPFSVEGEVTRAATSWQTSFHGGTLRFSDVDYLHSMYADRLAGLEGNLTWTSPTGVLDDVQVAIRPHLGEPYRILTTGERVPGAVQTLRFHAQAEDIEAAQAIRTGVTPLKLGVLVGHPPVASATYRLDGWATFQGTACDVREPPCRTLIREELLRVMGPDEG